MARSSLTPNTSKFLTLASVCIVIAGLYLAREVLIPLALAVLVTFLLAPLASRLERFRLGRIPSVLLVVLLALGAVGGLGWLISAQVKDLAEKLPDYRDEIVQRVRTVEGKFGGGPLAKATETVAAVAKAATTTTQPSGGNAVAAPRGTPADPVPVSIVPAADSGAGALRALTDALYVLEPLATAFIVVVFVVFMLVQREDLRDKVIRLMGHGQLTVTTQALDEAAQKVSKYLLTQSIVNGCFGVVVGLSLLLLDVPNAALWGLLCGLLRFIPYVGVWIGAMFPILLALVAPPAGWPHVLHLGPVAKPLVTLGVFLTAELVTGNVLEPWLYGSHTGVSSVAILVAAIFWTWLWGTAGLLLSTPLTVCLAVLGKYVPHLGFLHVLLGDQPVLAPHERFYQRLLADDPDEARECGPRVPQGQVAGGGVRHGLRARAVHGRAGRQPRHAGRRSAGGDPDEREGDGRGDARRGPAGPAEAGRRRHRDRRRHGRPRAAGARRGQRRRRGAGEQVRRAQGLHRQRGHPPRPRRRRRDHRHHARPPARPARVLRHPVSQDRLASEMVEAVDAKKADVVCVSALPPGAVAHSRYLCKRLLARYPDARMLVGLWTAKDLERLKSRLSVGEAVQVAGTLGEALHQIHQLVQDVLLKGPGDKPEPVPVGAAG